MSALVIEQIDPAQAALYLAQNRDNRRLEHARVRAFAAAITAGGWRPAAGPIEFAPDGTLVNGQHRLFAIVATGRTVPVAVLRRAVTP